MTSQPTESSWMIELQAWIVVNRKRLATVLVVVCLVALGSWIVATLRAQALAAAWSSLLKVEREGQVGTTATGPAAAALLKVAADESGTDAGAGALVLGAGVLYRDGKYAEAKAEFERFLAAYPRNDAAPAAALGLAACLDAQGKTAEALAAYQNVVTRYPRSTVPTQARLAMASIYEITEPAKAVKIYDELSRPKAPSAWSSEAAMRRERMLRKDPTLLSQLTPPPALAPVPSLSAASNAAPVPAVTK